MRRKFAVSLPTPQKQTFLKAMGEFAKQPLFMAMLAAPVIGGLAGAVENQVHKNKLNRQKATAFKSMIELHPHLRQRNQGEVHRIYSSLHNASPAMAADPMVAGAWVDNIIETKTPGMNSHQGLLNAVKDLSGIQWSVSQARHKDRGDNRLRNYVEQQVLEIGKGVAITQHNGLNEAYLAQRRDLEARADKVNAGYDKRLAELNKEQTEVNALRDYTLRKRDETEALEGKIRDRYSEWEGLRDKVMIDKMRLDKERLGNAPPRRRIVEMGKTSSAQPDLRSLLRALRV